MAMRGGGILLGCRQAPARVGTDEAEGRDDNIYSTPPRREANTGHGHRHGAAQTILYGVCMAIANVPLRRHCVVNSLLLEQAFALFVVCTSLPL